MNKAAGSVQEKDKAIAPEEPGSSEAEFEREFDTAMAEEGSSKEKPAGDGKKKPAAGEEKPGDKPAGEKTEKPAGDNAAAEEADKTFLKELGLEGETVSPAELARLKKVHGKLHADIQRLDVTARRYASQNKTLSEQYQTLKKAHGEIMAQQTPADRVKGIISKIDTSKLSPGVQKLIADPEMLEFMGLFMPGAPAAEEKPAGAGAGKDGGADEQPLSAEEQQAIAAEFEQAMTAANQGDFAKVYATPEFEAWIRRTAEAEVTRNRPLFEKRYGPDVPAEAMSPTLRAFLSLDPVEHTALLTRYKGELAAAEAERLAKEEADKKNDALRGHGPSGGGGAGSDDDYSEEQILSDDKAFDAMTDRIRKRRTGG